MLIDQLPDPAPRLDVVIVGGGAVGLTMAVRLARSGQRVLVVESGGAALRNDWESLNDAVMTGAKNHAGSLVGRYRGLGGTTRVWGGQLMPFTVSDLAPNPARMKPGWPLNHDELMHHTDQALQLLGMVPRWSDAEDIWCSVTGQPLDLGEELRLAPSLWLPQPDFALLFGKELRTAAGPLVLLGHEAVSLEVDAASGRVTGVVLRRADGSQATVCGTSTVIACGTLETARLLLRAQAALPQSPLAANRNVGRWFIDHLHGDAGEVTPHDRAAFGRLFDSFYARGLKLMPKVRLSDGVTEAGGLPNCAGVFIGALSPGMVVGELRSLARRIFAGDPGSGRLAAAGDAARMVRLMVPLVLRYLRDNRSSNFLGTTARFRMEMEQQPSPASFIALEAGVPAEQARIAVNWTIDGAEIEGFRRFALAMQAYCARAGLGDLQLDPRLLAGDVGYFDSCRDSNHQMGGARMATSAEHGVVDSYGAVFAMPGLHVAGAPIFPSGSFANPTLVGMALGQRIAGHLLGQSK